MGTARRTRHRESEVSEDEELSYTALHKGNKTNRDIEPGTPVEIRKSSNSRKVASSVDSSDDDSADLDGSWGIDATFEFCDPCDEDYQAVRGLLTKGGKFGKSVNVSDVADVICNQGNIGSTIKTDDDEANVFGFLSILNIKQYEKLKSVSDYLLELARLHAKPDDASRFSAIINEATSDTAAANRRKTVVGLVVNERFVNLPLQLIPTLHNVVMVEDIEWSLTTPEMAPEERPYYKFSHFIFIVNGYKDPKQAEVASTTDKSAFVYEHFENEFYRKYSTIDFQWHTGKKVRVPSSKNNKNGKNASLESRRAKEARNMETLEEYQMLFVVPSSRILSIVKRIRELGDQAPASQESVL